MPPPPLLSPVHLGAYSPRLFTAAAGQAGGAKARRWRPRASRAVATAVTDSPPHTPTPTQYFTFTDTEELSNEVEIVALHHKLTNMQCPTVEWVDTGSSSINASYAPALYNVLDDIDRSGGDGSPSMISVYAQGKSGPDVKLSGQFFGFQRCVCSSGYRLETVENKEIRRFSSDTVDAVMDMQECVLIQTNYLRIILSASGGVLAFLSFLLIVIFIFFRRDLAMMRLNYRKRRGPPREGEPLVVVATDVQGSTELWEWNGRAMAQASNIHDTLLRRLLPEHFGYEVVTEGDSFLCAFHDAVDATRWALQVQTELMEANWPAELDGNAHSATEVRSLLSEKLCVPEEAGKGIDAPEISQPSSVLSAVESQGSGRNADRSASSSSLSMKAAWSRLAKSRKRILDIGRKKGVERDNGRAVPFSYSVPSDCGIVYRGLRVRMGICSGPANFIGKIWRENRVTYAGGSASRAPLLADCVPGGHVVADGATSDAILEAGLDSIVPWALEQDGLELAKGARRSPSQARTRSFLWRSRNASPGGGGGGGGSTRSLYSRAPHQPASDVHFEALRKQPAKVLSLGELLLKDGTVSRVTTVCLADLALRLRDLGGVPCTSEDVDAAGIGVVDPGFFHAPATRAALDEYASSIFFGQNASGNAYQDELGALNSSAPSNLPPVTMVFTSLEGLSSARSRDAQAAETLMELHSEVLRSVKLKFGGYLCQVSDGTRMFAFRTASDGLSFALAAQIALLQYPWPPEVLALDVCCEAAPDAEGRPSLRGPRVRVGVYEGVPSMVVPHPSLGRADYFGPLVNRAARLCFGAARGGQIVADKSTAMQAVAEWRARDGRYVDRARHGWHFPESERLQVQVRSVGQYRFKGVAGEVSCVQVVTETLAARLDYWSNLERSGRPGVVSESNHFVNKSRQTRAESELLHIVPLSLPRSRPDSPFDFAKFIKVNLNNNGTKEIDTSHDSAILTPTMEGLSMDSTSLSARFNSWTEPGLEHVSSGRDAEGGE